MEPAQTGGWTAGLKFPQAMKYGMNENRAHVECIDSGREDGVEVEVAQPRIADSAHSIGQEPEQKLAEMRPRDGRDVVDDNLRIGATRSELRQVHALRIQVDFVAMVAIETND